MSRDLVGGLLLAEFWNDYLFIDEGAAPQWEPWHLTLSFPGGPPLRLSADNGYVGLALMLGSGPKEVAWDDLAHWHPHLLRWPELLAICRRFGSAVPAVDREAVLLLLARFAPITSAEDAEMAFPAIDRAWEMLGVQASAAGRRLRRLIDFRAAGVSWQDGPHGWCVSQDPSVYKPGLYSLRVADNPDFPWAEWRTLVASIEDAA